MSYARSADRQRGEPADPGASGASTTTTHSHVFGSMERNCPRTLAVWLFNAPPELKE